MVHTPVEVIKPFNGRVYDPCCGSGGMFVREMTDKDIAKIADGFTAFEDGTLEDEAGFCAAVSTEDIAKQDYILTPGRFVGLAEEEDDREPFEGRPQSCHA